ncbi:MAG: hypothetical protein ABWX94_02690 [Candidatus Saccharimonadales bacterium]
MLMAITLVVLIIIVRPGQKDAAAIPEAVIKLANFTPYFYEGSIPGKFRAIKGTTTYAANVLVIRLANNKNQTIVMTQQALPADLANTAIQGTEVIEGAPGSTTINVNEGRTTATLFSNDKKTLLIINTSDTIETSTIKELLRALKPLR